MAADSMSVCRFAVAKINDGKPWTVSDRLAAPEVISKPDP